jgi:hypothetical protein
LLQIFKKNHSNDLFNSHKVYILLLHNIKQERGVNNLQEDAWLRQWKWEWFETILEEEPKKELD